MVSMSLCPWGKPNERIQPSWCSWISNWPLVIATCLFRFLKCSVTMHVVIERIPSVASFPWYGFSTLKSHTRTSRETSTLHNSIYLVLDAIGYDIFITWFIPSDALHYIYRKEITKALPPAADWIPINCSSAQFDSDATVSFLETNV